MTVSLADAVALRGRADLSRPQTASSASYMAIAQLSEYACSKAAVLALHEVLGEELKHR